MTIHNVVRVFAVFLFVIGMLLTPMGGLIYRPYASTLPFEWMVQSGAHWKLGAGLILLSVVLFFASIVKDPDI
jgi:hypothetical protein